MQISEQEQRQRVCEEARSWLRTPYHHMGRVKGAGVDCATFLAEVYHAAGVAGDQVPIAYYPADWHHHKDDERYLSILTGYMHEIEESEAGPGDVVMFKIGRAFAHGAIILNWPLMIHAVWADCVQYGSAANDGKLVGRPRRFFSPWGKP